MLDDVRRLLLAARRDFMRVHAFVDAENVGPHFFFEGCKRMRRLHQIVQVDMFGKVQPHWTVPYRFIPCFVGKNSADMFMTAAIVRAIYEEPLTECFAIFTHDRDFIPVIQTVTDAKKHIVLVTEDNVIMERLRHTSVDMKYLTSIELPARRATRQPVHAKGYRLVSLPKSEVTHTARYDLKTCFIRTKSTLFEVPFANGMDMNTFCRIIPLQEIRQGHGKNKSMKDILKQSFLKVVDDKIYIDEEEL